MGTLKQRIVITGGAGAGKKTIDTGTVNLTTTNDGGPAPGEIATSTTEAAVVFGLTTPKVVFLENLDGTDSIDYGPESGGSMVKLGTLPPGISDKITLGAGVTLRVKASANTPRLKVWGYEA